MTREISSLQHPLVKHLVKLQQNRYYRYETQSVVVEGKKIIQELPKQHVIKNLLVLNNNAIPPGIECENIIFANESIFDKISSLHTSEGILAEVTMPKSAMLDNMKRVLAFDGISDPGNIGTLLRSALALGWEGVFLLENCCDPFNDKAIRAAKGATFRLPMVTGTWNELQELQKQSELLSFVADIHGTPIEDISKSKGILLVLSNEAHGPSKESLECCKAVTIPMSSEMESLNVSAAGAILMYILGKTND